MSGGFRPNSDIRKGKNQCLVHDVCGIPTCHLRAIALKNQCFIVFLNEPHRVIPECLYQGSISARLNHGFPIKPSGMTALFNCFKTLLAYSASRMRLKPKSMNNHILMRLPCLPPDEGLTLSSNQRNNRPWD